MVQRRFPYRPPPGLLRSANIGLAGASIARKRATTGVIAPEPLSPELQELSDQQDREREERKKKALNPRGGVGRKGGHAPIPLVGISPVPAPAPDAPAQ